MIAIIDLTGLTGTLTTIIMARKNTCMFRSPTNPEPITPAPLTMELTRYHRFREKAILDSTVGKVLVIDEVCSYTIQYG
jgi:hypothetical protein